MKKTSRKNKKGTTIDDLAGMVQRGFTEQSEKHNELFSDFKDFEKRTDQSIFNLQSDADEVKKRLGSIEKTLGPLIYMVDTIKFSLRDYELRISRLEKRSGIEHK